MDDRNGQIYSTRDTGVPERHIRQLAEYVDDRHCGQCGKPVKVRRNTPQKHGSDGRLYRFCNKCWYRRVGRGMTTPNDNTPMAGTPPAEAALTTARDRVAALEEALQELVALVRGECPSLLNEDSGGDAELALRIDAALKGAPGDE